MNRSEALRLALLGMIVKDREQTGAIQALLSKEGDVILGRMGLPHGERGWNLISLVMEAPKERIDRLAERLAQIKDVHVSLVYAELE